MSSLFIHNAKVYKNDSFVSANILIEAGKLKKIGCDLENVDNAKVIDAKSNYVIPGFFDVHTHGAAGIDVNSATADELSVISEFFAAKGCTRWLASILTDSEDKTTWSIKQIVKCMKENRNGAKIHGIHLEGPFLSSEFKGAMPEHLLQKGNVELLRKYQKIADNNIRYLTVSPEVDGVMQVIDYAKSQGIVVAVGHSGAGYDTAIEGIKRGITACTHTFNGMRLFHQHEPSVMGAVLESENVYCEAICDYFHLHPGAVRLLVKTKGHDKVLAITDSISAAGLPDGEYMLGVNEVVVNNGDARLKYGGTRAGSTLTMNQALINLMKMTNLPLIKVVRMFAVNQAKMLNIYDEYGSIDVGKCADITIIDNNYDIHKTIVEGKIVYEKAKV